MFVSSSLVVGRFRPRHDDVRRLAATAFATAVLGSLAGCASSGLSVDATDAVSEDSPSASSTVITSTADSVVGSSAATDSSAGSVEPTSSVDPPIDTTQSSASGPESDGLSTDDVERDLAAAIEDFDRCLVDLPDCDVATLSAARLDPVRSLTEGLISRGNTEGWVVDNVDSRTFDILETSIDADDGEASVTVCEVDDTTVRIPADPVAGTAEVIVEDEFVSTVKTWRLRLVEDQWLAFDIVDEQRAIGRDINQCI